MSMRPLLLSVAAASALLLSTAVLAHDPELHESHVAPAKAKPATCTQLADTQRYSSDLGDPEIKALKAKCDAAKKPAAKATDTAGKGK